MRTTSYEDRPTTATAKAQLRGTWTILELVEIGRVGVQASSLGTFAEHLRRLVATDIATQVNLGSTDKGRKFAFVLALDVLEGQHSSNLLVDNRAKTRLALNDHIGNAHLATESREEDD